MFLRNGILKYIPGFIKACIFSRPVLLFVLVLVPFITFYYNYTPEPIIIRYSVRSAHLSKFASPHLLMDSGQISTLFQEHLKNLQMQRSSSSCQDQINFMCGHQNPCGLGCQLHHRMACVMMSYALNLPVIHITRNSSVWSGWPYEDAWEDVFEPFGSSCTPGSLTYTWLWRAKRCRFYIFNSKEPCLTAHPNSTRDDLLSDMPFPLTDGIPVSVMLRQQIQTVATNPFLWLIGEFYKFVFKLNPEAERVMESFREKVGLGKNRTEIIVGIHVRRSDKITSKEYENAYQELDVYMEHAERFYTRFENMEGNMTQIKRVVFIASDESQDLIREAEVKYPSWDIRGFVTNETLNTRQFHLMDIVRDLVLLSECDFIVCTFTSNIGTLLWEIINNKYPKNPSDHLISIHGNYSYPVWYNKFAPVLRDVD